MIIYSLCDSIALPQRRKHPVQAQCLLSEKFDESGYVVSLLVLVLGIGSRCHPPNVELLRL